uniref:DNA mismatch repair protein MutL n=1 Tax=Eubacterium plexicaudatum ASF492 TaxID=1235802 RepID=N2BFH4_9FIRM
MPQIEVLDEKTIDRIAAGEVVERPSSVVKELVENAVDAKATAITIEIKDGGISFIRITDNGQGIPKEEVQKAFLRHATSKLKKIEDLLTISSLGFRGEALSSIAAVAQVEVITKTASELTGTKYRIEGSKEIGQEEIGAPEGTTFLVRNLFYNTPARHKFLKSAQTEASYISTLVERLALSHPDISFQLIVNNQPKLHTNGNTKLKDIIYHIFGRDIAAGVLPVRAQCDLFSIDGYIGKPIIARGNRNFEIYFINGRYIKSTLLTKCIEDAYKPYLMKHQYPFTVLHMQMDSEWMDVNVHPTKMELRFWQSEQIYEQLSEMICSALRQKDMVPEVPLVEQPDAKTAPKPERRGPEPFEKKRLEAIAQSVKKDSPYERKYTQTPERTPEPKTERPAADRSVSEAPRSEYQQLTLAESSVYHADFIREAKRRNYRIIGQLFDTYWLVQVENELFIIDQHAAYEKVLYEEMMRRFAEHTVTSQQISPPMIITMTMQEQELFETYQDAFRKTGFEINAFGGREYAVCAVPANLYNLNRKELFLEMLDGLSQDTGKKTPDYITEKIASMSCKAAVKGRQQLSLQEAEQLLADLLKLENPYHCPHGRPTIIAMSKTEIEKKFRRIV